MVQIYVIYIQIMENYKYKSKICTSWEGVKLIKIMPIFHPLQNHKTFNFGMKYSRVISHMTCFKSICMASSLGM